MVNTGEEDKCSIFSCVFSLDDLLQIQNDSVDGAGIISSQTKSPVRLHILSQQYVCGKL